jgi:hypothetical protein
MKCPGPDHLHNRDVDRGIQLSFEAADRNPDVNPGIAKYVAIFRSIVIRLALKDGHRKGRSTVGF